MEHHHERIMHGNVTNRDTVQGPDLQAKAGRLPKVTSQALHQDQQESKQAKTHHHQVKVIMNQSVYRFKFWYTKEQNY